MLIFDLIKIKSGFGIRPIRETSINCTYCQESTKSVDLFQQGIFRGFQKADFNK